MMTRGRPKNYKRELRVSWSNWIFRQRPRRDKN